MLAIWNVDDERRLGSGRQVGRVGYDADDSERWSTCALHRRPRDVLADRIPSGPERVADATTHDGDRGSAVVVGSGQGTATQNRQSHHGEEAGRDVHDLRAHAELRLAPDERAGKRLLAAPKQTRA